MMRCKICDIPVRKATYGVLANMYHLETGEHPVTVWNEAWFHVNGDPNTETIAREVYDKDE